jgi:hypothetical protein
MYAETFIYIRPNNPEGNLDYAKDLMMENTTQAKEWKERLLAEYPESIEAKKIKNFMIGDWK